MQVQLPPMSASAAASNVSQGSVRERSNAGDPAGTPTSGIIQLGKSEAANPDRDAQGGGDTPLERRKRSGINEIVEHKSPDAYDGLPVRAPEPASQLDLLG